MKKIILSTFAFATLLLASCESYLDSPNEDFSNNPFSDGISPAQKLAGAQLNLLNNEVFSYNLFGNRMTYAYALNGGFTSSDPAYTFNFSADSYTGGTWVNQYLYVDNMQDIIDSEALFPDYANHVAIAKIMKVQGMEKIISLYGDAPYSEAFSADFSNVTPKFDDDVEIWKDLFLVLDNARNQIMNASASVIIPGGEDIVYGGDMNAWITYANTLELRMLVRLSNTTNTQLATVRDARAALLANDFVATDVAYNPGFSSSTAVQANPLFRIYGTDIAITAWSQSNRANAAGEYMASVLNGTLNTPMLDASSVIDPRRGRMFNTVGGVIYGAVQGTEVNASFSRISSYVHGMNFAAGAQGALTNATTRDAYAMLASESYFLQAEAVERGLLPGGTTLAQALFEQGIVESFQFYSAGFGSLTGAYSTLNPYTYIAAIDSKNGLGWTGSTNKIHAIVTQKWLATAQWTGIESYFDNLRTNHNAPVPSGVSQTTRPNRLIYDSSEYSSNSANVPSVVLGELFTINSKTPAYLQ